MIVLDLILNLSLLVALSIVSGFIEHYLPRNTRWGMIAQGTLYGSVAVLGMLRPVQLEPGLIFDGRTVMISLCALFHGPLAALVAVVLTMFTRVHIGGVGMFVGLLTILSSAVIGLLVHYYSRSRSKYLTVRHLLSLGVAVHLTMLALLLLLPWDTALTTIRAISLPVLFLYPLATILAGKILLDQESNLRFIDQLQQAREHLHITLGSIQEAVISTDLEGRIIYMNPTAETLTGWKNSEVHNRPLSDFIRIIDRDSREELITPVEQVLAAGKPVQVSNHTLLVARNGAEHHISENAAPMHDAVGRLLGVVFVIRDVTAEYTAREKLRESESLFRNIFEHHSAVKLLIDPTTGAIIAANRAAEEFYGWPVGSLKRMRIQDINILTPEEIALEMEKAKTCKRIHFEFRHRLADGSVRDVEVFSSGVTIGGKALLHSIVQDITTRKMAERALAANEQYIQSVFSAAPVGIGVVNNRIFRTVNDRLCAMTGYAREELIGQSTRLLYVSDQDFVHIGKVLYSYLDAPTAAVEACWQRKDGRRIDVLLCSSSLAPITGETSVTFTALDISERNDAEREKEKLQIQLLQAQKIESVGRLTGGVAHDFNNILSIIVGYNELALEEAVPGSDMHGHLQKIQEAGQRSANVIKQLLAFSRQQTIAPKVLDLNDAVSSLMVMLKRLIGEHIDFVWAPGHNLPPVYMDPSQIDQILVNLCVNASDAIAGTGSIVVETSTVFIDEAYGSQHSGVLGGHYVTLTVRDNGCGMEPTVMEKIFEPFFTTKAVGEGTGLGLSTVYGIAKQNNGFVNVASEPGKGTSLTIYLPRHEANTTGAEGSKGSPPKRGHGETVLLVEDDPVLLEMSRTILKRLDYKVLPCNSPSTAQRLAAEQTESIDLLLTDVIMPEMNGRELADRLLALHPEMKVLFMSGYTANVINRHGVLDSGTHFLHKPFSTRELAAKMREALA